MLVVTIDTTMPKPMERGMSEVGKSSTRGLGGGMPHTKDHAKTATTDRGFERGNPMTKKPAAL